MMIAITVKMTPRMMLMRMTSCGEEEGEEGRESGEEQTSVFDLLEFLLLGDYALSEDLHCTF